MGLLAGYLPVYIAVCVCLSLSGHAGGGLRTIISPHEREYGRATRHRGPCKVSGWLLMKPRHRSYPTLSPPLPSHLSSPLSLSLVLAPTMHRPDQLLPCPATIPFLFCHQHAAMKDEGTVIFGESCSLGYLSYISSGI